jgi:hypothetical protein
MTELVAWLMEVLGLNRPRPLTNVRAKHEPSQNPLELSDQAH